jgi:membrane-associated protease RseP (regulator of RpoE activity)
VSRQARTYALHLLLAALTLFTTTLAGAELITGRPWDAWLGKTETALAHLLDGLPYSLSFLAFLTFHEFGHYFMAVYYGVRTSLPYYIPVYFPFAPMNIGSFGAVIRLRSQPLTNAEYFDVGVAGPLAGFVVSFALLTYGYTHLPPAEYLYNIHPDYRFINYDTGALPTEAQIMERIPPFGPVPFIYRTGDSALTLFFESYIADPKLLPNHFEIIHYPFIFVGFLTLFFTALNLLPIGQLDGGHVVYGIFGRKRANLVSRVTIVLLVLFGGTGFVLNQEFNIDFSARGISNGIYYTIVTFIGIKLFGGFTRGIIFSSAMVTVQWALILVFPEAQPSPVWVFYAFIGTFLIRPDHPPAQYERPLDAKRKAVGVLALVIFILSFTPRPISLENTLAQQKINRAKLEKARPVPNPRLKPIPFEDAPMRLEE